VPQGLAGHFRWKHKKEPDPFEKAIDFTDEVLSKDERRELKAAAADQLLKHGKLSEEVRQRLLDLFLYERI